MLAKETSAMYRKIENYKKQKGNRNNFSPYLSNLLQNKLTLDRKITQLIVLYRLCNFGTSPVTLRADSKDLSVINTC